MAELVKNYDNGSAIKIVYSYSQNVSKNQSTLTMSLYVHRDGYGPSWNTHCDSYMQVDGSSVMTYDGSFNIGTSWVKIGSTVSKTVTHNADGTKTVALKGFFDSQGLTTKLQNLTVTGNVTLKTIPRASSISSISGNTIGSLLHDYHEQQDVQLLSRGTWLSGSAGMHPCTAQLPAGAFQDVDQKEPV